MAQIVSNVHLTHSVYLSRHRKLFISYIYITYIYPFKICAEPMNGERIQLQTKHLPPSIGQKPSDPHLFASLIKINTRTFGVFTRARTHRIMRRSLAAAVAALILSFSHFGAHGSFLLNVPRARTPVVCISGWFGIWCGMSPMLRTRPNAIVQ